MQRRSLVSGIAAKNDGLIEEFVRDENYRVLETGVVMTRFDGGGHLTDHWRRCDWRQCNSGYRRVRYRGKKLTAHRIVFRAFNGVLAANLTINHKDGDPSNNRPENLELVTQSENLRHSYRTLGRTPNTGRQKIDQATANKIRSLFESGISQKILAGIYGLSKSTVNYIVHRKTWKEPASG